MRRRAAIASILCVALLACSAPEDRFQEARHAFDGGDHDVALREWTQLANEGHTESQHNLAVMYYKGAGVEQDLEAARTWFLKAAEGGSDQALLSLGVIYAKGDGVAIDYVEAYKWTTLALQRNNPAANQLLSALMPKMSANEIAEAERLAALWSPSGSAEP